MRGFICGIVFFFVAFASSHIYCINHMITVVDTADRSVSVPHNPSRIVCIGPGTLRLIVYLRAEKRLVGVEDLEKMNPSGRPYWIAHPELHKLPRCGPGGLASINQKPDMETILSLNPQVIFISYMDASLADEVQRISQIPVVVLSYGQFGTFDETFYKSLNIAGKILNKEERAISVINYIEKLKLDLKKRTYKISRRRRPEVYVGGIGYRGSHGIESTEQNYAPFDWVNAINLAKKLKPSVGTHIFLDKETLLKLNPEIIFLDGGGLSTIANDYRRNRTYYNALKAFHNKQVFILFPFNWYVTNVDTVLVDAYAVGKVLYPEQFADVDLKDKSNEIYEFLVGSPVYSEMEKTYGTLGKVPEFLK